MALEQRFQDVQTTRRLHNHLRKARAFWTAADIEKTMIDVFQDCSGQSPPGAAPPLIPTPTLTLKPTLAMGVLELRFG